MVSQNNQEDKDFFKALEEFRTAVDNGQLRLALMHLVVVIDEIVDVLSQEDDEEEASVAEVKPVVEEEKVATPKVEKKVASAAPEKEKVSE
jgi:uncharacterized membrane protein